METLAYLADVTARSFCLAAAALAAVWLLRVKTAAGRHAVMTALAAGMLLLAVFRPALPPLPVRVLRAAPAAVPSAAPVYIVQPSAPVEASPAAAMPGVGPSPWRLRVEWPELAALLYYSGAAALLLRMVYGYLFARRLVGHAVRLPAGGIAGQDSRAIYESGWISVPLTAGWLRPKILLPPGWHEWAPDKLEAVLAHEGTHIERADWAIGMLAAVNRCVFWFNPLAWWLERQMALLAEQACDNAAVLATGARESYAQALLDMAAAVRSGRGRVTWEAMAMARTAEVRKRIERVLDEARQIPRGMTRRRWVALVACGLPVVYLATVVQPARALRAAAAMPPAPQIAQPLPTAPAPQGQPASPPQTDGRYVALYFETGTLSPSDVPKSFATFQQANTRAASAGGNNFFYSLVRPGDFVAVMSMDAGGALRVNQDFTTDGNLVSKAVQARDHSEAIPKYPGPDQRVKALADAMNILSPLAGTKTLVYFAADPSLPRVVSSEQWRYLAELGQATNTTLYSMMIATGRFFASYVTAMGHAPYTYVVPLSATFLPKPDATYPYSPEPLAPGVKGDAEFRVILGSDGHVKEAHFLSGNPSLESMARDMLNRYAYQPPGVTHENLAGFETRADVQCTLDRRSPTRAPDTIEMKDFSGFQINEAPDSPPVLLTEVQPDYPLEVRANGLQGIVTLSATVATDGIPQDIQVLKAPPGGGSDEAALRAAALKAAGQWRFAPARDYTGRPVESPVTLEMTFRLM